MDKSPKPHGKRRDLASCSLHIQKSAGFSTGSGESLRDRAVIQSQLVAGIRGKITKPRDQIDPCVFWMVNAHPPVAEIANFCAFADQVWTITVGEGQNMN